MLRRTQKIVSSQHSILQTNMSNFFIWGVRFVQRTTKQWTDTYSVHYISSNGTIIREKPTSIDVHNIGGIFTSSDRLFAWHSMKPRSGGSFSKWEPTLAVATAFQKVIVLNPVRPWKRCLHFRRLSDVYDVILDVVLTTTLSHTHT